MEDTNMGYGIQYRNYFWTSAGPLRLAPFGRPLLWSNTIKDFIFVKPYSRSDLLGVLYVFPWWRLFMSMAYNKNRINMTSYELAEDDRRIDRLLAKKQEKEEKRKRQISLRQKQRRVSKNEWKRKHPFLWLSELQKKRYGIIVNPMDLWKMAKKQKMMCPYSGIKLTNGNIHIDHIIPRCKGGSNDISNLQLLPAEINMFKRGYLEETFINLCERISDHSQ